MNDEGCSPAPFPPTWVPLPQPAMGGHHSHQHPAVKPGISDSDSRKTSMCLARCLGHASSTSTFPQIAQGKVGTREEPPQQESRLQTEARDDPSSIFQLGICP